MPLGALFSVALFYNYLHASVKSSSYILDDGFYSETIISTNKSNYNLMSKRLEIMQDLCILIKCDVTATSQEGSFLEFDYSLLNVFIKFKGIVDIIERVETDTLSINIDGELFFSSNAVSSPSKITGSVEIKFYESTGKPYFKFLTQVNSKLIQLAIAKFSERIVLSTLEAFQGNMLTLIAK